MRAFLEIGRQHDAWIYRIIYNFKNRKEFTLNAVNSLDDENTQALAQKELELFKEIGL